MVQMSCEQKWGAKMKNALQAYSQGIKEGQLNAH